MGKDRGGTLRKAGKTITTGTRYTSLKEERRK